MTHLQAPSCAAEANAAKANPAAKSGGGSLREWFRHFAAWVSAAAGSPWAFAAAAIFLIVWLFSYPLFRALPNAFDSWQLVINTVTTIITFLMVFLIQNSQNRDSKAIHLKLDELIRAMKGARNHLVELEDCTDEELEQLKREFNRIRSAVRKDGGRGDQEIAAIEIEERDRTGH